MRFAIVTWKEMSQPERVGLFVMSTVGFVIGIFGSLDQNLPSRAVAEPAAIPAIVRDPQHSPPARPQEDAVAIFARGSPVPRYIKDF